MPNLNWHELADLKHDLHELDIEMQKARDNLSLLQNAIALMVEQIDDLTIGRKK